MKYDVLISGPQYELFSKKAENQKSVNCFHQFIESKQGTGATVLMRSPGLRAISVPYSFDVGTARGGFELNERLYILKNQTFYQLDGNFSITGVVNNISNVENQAVHIAHSNDTAMFVSDGLLYRIPIPLAQGSTNNVPQIIDAASGAWPSLQPAVDIAYIGGYFVAVDAGTQLWFSTGDLTAGTPAGAVWDGANFQDVPGPGARNVAVIEHLNVLYVYTARAVIPFIVGPDANAPFVPQTSGIIPYGLEAHASLQALGNSRYWMGRNKEGQGVIYRGQGYSVQKVSDLGVDNAIMMNRREMAAAGETLGESTGMVYQLGGQEFYRIIFPTLDHYDQCWEFNATLGEWEQLTWTNVQTGETFRHRANLLISAFDRIVAADYKNGWLYELTISDDIPFVGQTVTDFGYPIRGIRRGPSIVGDSNNRVFYDELVLGAQVGVGLEQPLWLQTYRFGREEFISQVDYLYDVQVITLDQHNMLTGIYDQIPYVPFAVPYPDAATMLQLGFVPWGATAVGTDGTSYGGPPEVGMAHSDDGGMSYNARRYRSLGRAGEFAIRIAWMRMGIARDRIVDFTWDHPCVQALTTAWWTSPQQTPS